MEKSHEAYGKELIVVNQTENKVVLLNTQSNKITSVDLPASVPSAHLLSPVDALNAKTCFACGQSISYIHSNYFYILSKLFTGGAASYTHDSENSNASPKGAHFYSTASNNGYYARFFRQIRQLGRGYRGAVFYCQHSLSPDIVLGYYAVKKIPVGENKEWLMRMLNEVYLMEETRHLNIIEYRHCWIEDAQLTTYGPVVPCLFVLMEFANGGNLEDYVMARFSSAAESSSSSINLQRARLRKLSWNLSEEEASEPAEQQPPEDLGLTASEIWSFFIDISAGLAHLHQHGILHRDLKASNLLLRFIDIDSATEIPSVLITDFGESENLHWSSSYATRTGTTGTIEYTAPELLKCSLRRPSYAPSADVWSLGMNLYFMSVGKLPYINLEDISSLRQEIVDYSFSQPEMADLDNKDIFQMISMLLRCNPRERPTVGEILRAIESMGISRQKERQKKRRKRRALTDALSQDDMATTSDEFVDVMKERRSVFEDITTQETAKEEPPRSKSQARRRSSQSTLFDRGSLSTRKFVQFACVLLQLSVFLRFSESKSWILLMLAAMDIFIDNLAVLLGWTLAYSLTILALHI